VPKAREKHKQTTKSESSDAARGIVDTDNPRMTAYTLVNELVSVLYPCNSDVHIYRPTFVIKMAAFTIDMIRTNHRSTENILMTLFHLGCD